MANADMFIELFPSFRLVESGQKDLSSFVPETSPHHPHRLDLQHEGVDSHHWVLYLRRSCNPEAALPPVPHCPVLGRSLRRGDDG